MPKPSIGQSNWGQTLNDHLDTLQTQASLEADVAARVGEGGVLDSALSASFAKGVNLESFPGVDPTGATECRAAVQAAIDAAEAAGVPLVAKAGSFFKIATGVTIKKDCDLSRAVFDYTAASGVAITVGDTAGSVLRKDIRTPYVIASAKTVAGWAQVAGSVGVRIHNANESQIHVRQCVNFETGLQLYSDAAPGVAYNEIYLGHLSNNKRNLQMVSDADGWTNQNNLHAGRLSHLSPEGSLVAGTRQILMEGDLPFVPDGNNFYGTSIENLGVAEYLIDCNGAYNDFYGCRYEWAGTPGDQAVIWRGTAHDNRLQGGYGVEDLTIEREAGTANNDVISPAVNQSLWIPASSMAPSSGGPLLETYAGVPYWNLRDSNSDVVAAEVLIPADWHKADVTVHWFSPATGNAYFALKVQSHIPGAAVGFASFASGTPVIAAAPGGTYTATTTLVGDDTAVAAGPAHFAIERDGTAGTDTLGGSVYLLGLSVTRAA